MAGAAWHARRTMLYTRPQLKLLLALAAIFLVGLGVREWRAGFPAAADRLERFDREDVPPATPLIARPPAPPPQPRADHGVAAQPPGAPSADPPLVVRVAKSPPPAAPLDLNSASADELARLPGVGLGLAQRILDERKRRGRFESPEALRHVLGLGPKKLAAIRDLVTIIDAP